MPPAHAIARARSASLLSSAALRGALLAAPMAGFWLLLAAPSLDGRWEQHPGYTVIGDTVNVAARLEASAPLGRVAIGEATLRRLPRAQAEALGPVRVKGKREPVDAYVLEAV